MGRLHRKRTLSRYFLASRSTRILVDLREASSGVVASSEARWGITITNLRIKDDTVKGAPLGKEYHDGELIVEQGAEGDCMYVIQKGKVEIVARDGEKEVRLAVRGPGDIIGEMALFEKETRSADVRALGTARLLRIDRRNFMARIHEDPTLAFRLVQMLSSRVRELSKQLADLKSRS
jgi:CRP-like cAMP-binding protein